MKGTEPEASAAAGTPARQTKLDYELIANVLEAYVNTVNHGREWDAVTLGSGHITTSAVGFRFKRSELDEQIALLRAEPTFPSTGRPDTPAFIAAHYTCGAHNVKGCGVCWPSNAAPVSGEGTGTLTRYRVTSHGDLVPEAEWTPRNQDRPVVYPSASVDATLAAKDERIAELEAFRDAFDAGQEASLKGEPRESNPHPPGDSYGVGTLWLQWDDGYDCNINRKLKAEVAAKDAQLAELHPLRQALSDAQDDLTQARIRIDVLEPGARNYNAQQIRADKAEDALVEMTRRMEMFAAQATHAKESTEFVKGERDIAESTLADLRRQGEPEVCICAAILFSDNRIARGHRHSDCFKTAAGWTPKPPQHIIATQGFITSRNRFVDRKEAARLQIAAGIPSRATERPYHNGECFSEDLY